MRKRPEWDGPFLGPEECDRLDRAYDAFMEQGSLQKQLAMLGTLAVAIWRAWEQDETEANSAQAAVVVGSESSTWAVVADGHRAIDTWPIYVAGLAGFPLAPSSAQANAERDAMLQGRRRHRGDLGLT